MKKLVAVACLLLLAGVGTGQAQEYNSLIYFANGAERTGAFINFFQQQVTLRVDGQANTYNVNQIGVIIFDHNYTNFQQDAQLKNNASPHTVVLKDGTVIYGQVTNVQVGGRIFINTNNGTVSYPSPDVARFYLNPVTLFNNMTVQSAKNLVVKGNNNANKGGNKGGNKGNNANKGNQFQRLGGGEVFITFRNGGTTRGAIFDADSNPLQLVLRDGRRFPMTSIYQINYFETRPRYPADNNLQRGGATLIFRNGGSTFGQIIDYKGQDQWMLSDGRLIPANQLKRIVFR